MSTDLGLSTLSFDIIRRIVRMDDRSMESMRLISRSWNAIILGILKDPRNILPLERLYLTTGINLHEEYSMYAEKDRDMKRRVEQAHQRIHMYAIMPDRVAYKVGMNKWLTIHKNFDNAVELTCEPQMLASPNTNCLFAPFASCFSTETKNSQSRSARFARLFRSFAHIEKLVLDWFICRAALDRAIASLKEARIKNLEIRDPVWDNALQKRIVKLIRRHDIQYVSIITFRCDQHKLKNFIVKLVKLGAMISIYEACTKKSVYKEVREYFHRPLEFWSKMKADLLTDNISFNMTTIHDSNFKAPFCPKKMASSYSTPKTSVAKKMTTTATAQDASPKIPPSSSALPAWAYSPAVTSFRSGMTTPGSVGELSRRLSSTNFIKPGKSLAESIVTLTLIGVASLLLASLETLLGGVIVANLALLAGLYAYQWTQVHSYKLDPRCSIILDEANVLSITSNFDHEMLGFIQRLEPTKKRSESAEALLKPTSLWDALFFDDRRYKIEEFYRGVYGNEYAVAKKREEEEMEEIRKRASSATSVEKTQELSDEQKSPRSN